MQNEKIKIMLVDNHLFFRKSIVNLVKRFKHIDVICELNTIEEYLEKICTTSPDVALIDVKIRNTDDLSAIKQSTREHPDIKIIALTFNDHGTDYINALMNAGVSGIIDKDSTIEGIVNAIMEVHKGKDTFFNT